MPITKQCAVCGKDFQTKSVNVNRAKYCSRECQCRGQSLNPNESNRVLRICQVCGKPFTVKQSESKLRYCCSRACADKNKSSHPDNIWTKYVCENCGKKYSQRTYRTEAYKHHFCCKSCHFEWQAKQHGAYSYKLTCQICGKPFERSRFFVEVRKDAKFCSRKCLDRYNSLNKRRDKNVNWTGGNSATDYGEDWSQQNKLARRRDGNQCVLCHAPKQAWHLDVHHIIPFKSFGYVMGENENYKQANQLENLITLCKKCHRRVEHKPYLLSLMHPVRRSVR